MAKAKKEKQKFSPLGRAIIIISLSAAFLISAANIGVYTWAKYHSEDSGKGVATVSSDFFFLSNKLTSVQSIEWERRGATEGEAIDELHSFEYVYGDSTWDATTPCVFNIEMYNYENTLRYNAETIKYTIYAKLLEEPSDPEDTYTFIQYSDDHTRELGRYDLTDMEEVKIENVELEGDIASKNYFGLIVNPNDSDTFSPANVIIYAEITSPDYIDASSYYLGGIFSAQAQKQSFSVTGEFDVESEIDDGGTDWLSALNDLSGYIYTATTEGEADAEHDIILYWDSSYLNFDLHNSYYTEKTVLDSSKQYKERTPIEYDNFIARGKVEDLPEEDQVSGYTDYLIYHALANTNSSFVFYKGENWNTDGTLSDENGEVITAPASYSAFKKLAMIKLY